jgi:hypothetical protein
MRSAGWGNMDKQWEEGEGEEAAAAPIMLMTAR